jgi:hypothetical protein
MALGLFLAAAHLAWADPDFPLRNGDFSRLGHANGTPADWGFLSQTGQYQLQVEPATADAPAGVRLKAIQPGRGVLYQDILLLPGSYVLRLEARTEGGGRALMLAADATSPLFGDVSWGPFEVPFTMGAEPRVRIHLYAIGSGSVSFRGVRIDIKELVSAPVPCERGAVLGKIQVPPDATAAESYAAYELQRVLQRLTGRTPGLEGRDRTAAGRAVRVGRAAGAAALERLKALPPDSYLLATAADDSLLLAGNTDLGTLYAVYDFLRLQGCGWYTVGPTGEVIPKREALALPGPDVLESPDWTVRGLFEHRQQWRPDGGWEYPHSDDYIDWAVRNRLNAFWARYADTIDFGAYRGHGLLLRTNHSWGQFWLGAGNKPLQEDWAPLVNGKRQPLHVSGRPNLACTSNPAFREHVTATVLAFFRSSPQTCSYGVNADDEPAFWCECAACRAQDPDAGKGPWVLDKNGMPKLAMTDRALNFVNQVAAGIAPEFPDKQVEMYGYGSTREAPTRERVHPNVLIKYAYWPSTPLGISLSDTTIEYNRRVATYLDGWRQAGAQHFGLYDYGHFTQPDIPIFWFANVVDSLRLFHERWGFRHYLGENDSIFWPSMMLYNVRARALWDSKVDYHAVIQEVCRGYFGAAAEPMQRYFTSMDDALQVYGQRLKQTAQDTPPPAAPAGDATLTGDPLSTYSALQLLEYDLGAMQSGRDLLEQASAVAATDPALQARLAPLRFGHAVMTMVVAQRDQPATAAAVATARAAWESAKDIRQRYNLRIDRGTGVALNVFYFPPVVERALLELPLEWRFRTDAQDAGLQANWAGVAADAAWTPIRTDRAWTEQGHAYHGVAWYTVTFQLDEAARQALAERPGRRASLVFGAIDGDADVFLDGNKIGEQKQDVGFMWDKPFAVDLPETFAVAAEHRLTVRVRKDLYAAGIWRPVTVALLRQGVER